MDEFDAAILRHLVTPRSFHFDFRPAFADVAKVVGLDEDTVRLRVKRMEASGFLLGWEIGVHPAAFGRDMVRFDAPSAPPERKEDAFSRLAKEDGARMLFDFYRGGLALVAYAEPAAIPRLREAVALATGSQVHTWAMPLPPLGVEIDRKDWQLIRALRAGPKRSLHEVAEDLGTSPKTARRRVDALVDGRALFLSIRTDFARLARAIPVTARVVLRDAPEAAHTRAALRELPNLAWVNVDGPVAQLSVFAPNVAAAEGLQKTIEALPAVERVFTDVFARRIVLDDWLDRETAARSA